MTKQNKPALKILFVTPVDPTTVRSGAGQRSAILLEALQEVGIVDTVVVGRDESTTGQHADHLYFLGLSASIKWHKLFAIPSFRFFRAIEELLHSPLETYDVIVGRYSFPVSLLRTLSSSKVKVLVDMDDMNYRYHYSTRLQRCIAKSQSILRSFQNWILIQRFHGFLFVSLMDVPRWLTKPYRIVPNIPYSSATSSDIPSPKKGRTILFVGGLWYAPNAHGIRWFVMEVWSRILEKVPEANFVVVGEVEESMSVFLAKQQRVSVLGFVEDLDEVYTSSSVCIAPLFFGGGTNIKVLEAISKGVPCVASLFGIRGFHDELIQSGGVRATDLPEEFADMCIDRLKHPERFEEDILLSKKVLSGIYSRTHVIESVKEAVVDTMNPERECG